MSENIDEKKVDEKVVAAQTKEAQAEWMDGWKRGPQRTRWTKIPLQVGDKAPDFTLADMYGNQVKLSQYWKSQPALILFWRHYGCGCGTDRAKRLLTEIEDYKRAKANVVIIGQGEPERSFMYAVKYGLKAFPILSDTEFKVYEAYDLLEGAESQILFDAQDELLCRFLEAGQTFAQTREAEGRPLVDNPWLLPGEFVVDTKGIIRLAYRYNYCEDYPDHRVHIAAIREATGDLKKEENGNT